jgi:hypothetical protein
MAGVPTRSGALRTLEFRDTPNMASIQRPENVAHRSDDASPMYRTYDDREVCTCGVRG